MAAPYCYEGIPLSFMASLLIYRCASSVYEISMISANLAGAALKRVY